MLSKQQDFQLPNQWVSLRLKSTLVAFGPNIYNYHFDDLDGWKPRRQFWQQRLGPGTPLQMSFVLWNKNDQKDDVRSSRGCLGTDNFEFGISAFQTKFGRPFVALSSVSGRRLKFWLPCKECLLVNGSRLPELCKTQCSLWAFPYTPVVD